MQGKIKWFNDRKGFGFIQCEGKEDIFVHYSSIVGKGHKTLNDGDFVSFDLVQTDKGLQAKNVVVINFIGV